MSRVLGQSGGGDAATLLWAAYGATAAVGALLTVPALQGRLHAHAMTISLAVAAFGGLLSALPGHTAEIGGAVCIGLGLVSTPAVASAYARERVDASFGPSAIASATVAAAAGQIAGPFVAGVVIDAAGLSAIPILVAVSYAVSALLAFGDQRSGAMRAAATTR
jgi:hypothetical protein